jgi:hypothetical protein
MNTALLISESRCYKCEDNEVERMSLRWKRSEVLGVTPMTNTVSKSQHSPFVTDHFLLTLFKIFLIEEVKIVIPEFNNS